MRFNLGPDAVGIHGKQDPFVRLDASEDKELASPTSLDHILKSRDITLPTKVHIVKAMVFFSSHVQM